MQKVLLELSKEEAVVLWDIIKDRCPMEIETKLQNAMHDAHVDLNTPVVELPSTLSMGD